MAMTSSHANPLLVTIHSPDPAEAQRFLDALAPRLAEMGFEYRFTSVPADGPFRWVVAAETSPDNRLEGSGDDSNEALARILEWVRNATASLDEEAIAHRRLTDLGYL
jgi:hypothetical protein